MEGRHHHEHCHRCPRPHSAAVRRARHFHQPSRLGQRAERGETFDGNAALCALPPSSLKNILYGKSQNPKILTIKLLCDGLGITLGEFFSTPEFDALEQELQ